MIKEEETTAEQDGEECLTCETEVINGGTWGYCAECWDEQYEELTNEKNN
jgi:hypothetical protein